MLVNTLKTLIKKYQISHSVFSFVNNMQTINWSFVLRDCGFTIERCRWVCVYIHWN